MTKVVDAVMSAEKQEEGHGAENASMRVFDDVNDLIGTLFGYASSILDQLWKFISLKTKMVGERGFEPPTPWSRTRFKLLLKSVEI